MALGDHTSARRRLAVVASVVMFTALALTSAVPPKAAVQQTAPAVEPPAPSPSR